MTEARHHYRESGLSNVYLINGFSYVETPYGRSVVIEDVDGLHRAIGQVLTREKKSLSGREFRFLRHELDLSQARLASLFGVDAQSVARWEKGRTRIPGAVERMMRAVYEEHIGGHRAVTEILSGLAELDDRIAQELSFEDTDEGWRPAEAA
jgi:DNA-binding transcriptional regulator YiaG